MSKYIDSGDLLYKLADKITDGFDADWFEKVEAVIDKLPAADVEPVKYGTWTLIVPLDADTDDTIVQCTVCGEEFVVESLDNVYSSYNRCPCCGAKMRRKDGKYK